MEIYPVDSAIHLLNNWSLGDIVRYHARAAREMRHDIASSSLARAFLAPVVQKVDSAIQRINLYPVDSAIGFPNT